MLQRSRLRQLWWSVHRWIGLSLMGLLVPIAISGALQVYQDELDSLLNPKRWAVSGAQLALSPSQYFASANKQLAPNEQAISIRYPRDPGAPVRVLARQQAEPGSGRRPRLITVFLDPPTGTVLDKVDFRASLFGFLHVFHENLTIPQHYGRQIIGWAGVGMLILSLSGIWLWWPQQGNLLRALRWRRTSFATSNLHHVIGFWISIPLAVVSLTGIYLSFPQTARTAMSAIATMQPPAQSTIAATVITSPNLTAEEAMRLAQQVEPNARPATLFLPTEPSRRPPTESPEQGAGRDAEMGRDSRIARDSPAPTWRIQLLKSDLDLITVTIDDRTSTTRRLPDSPAGNRAAQWIRWIHEGSRGGSGWRFIVFLTGIFPVIFAVTGLLMWQRSRRVRKRATVRNVPEREMVAAE